MNAKKKVHEFKVGEIAYIDGRDFQARPPLMVMDVNLWDGVPRRRVVNRLRHGDKVRIKARKRADDRWYYRVRRGLRQGWISDPFLSEEHHEPIGERFER